MAIKHKRTKLTLEVRGSV